MSCDEVNLHIYAHIHEVHSCSLGLDLLRIRKAHKCEKISTFSSSVIQTGSVSGAIWTRRISWRFKSKPSEPGCSGYSGSLLTRNAVGVEATAVARRTRVRRERASCMLG